jgi:cysteine-rich repeat protein
MLNTNMTRRKTKSRESWRGRMVRRMRLLYVFAHALWTMPDDISIDRHGTHASLTLIWLARQARGARANACALRSAASPAAPMALEVPPSEESEAMPPEPKPRLKPLGPRENSLAGALAGTFGFTRGFVSDFVFGFGRARARAARAQAGVCAGLRRILRLPRKLPRSLTGGWAGWAVSVASAARILRTYDKRVAKGAALAGILALALFSAALAAFFAPSLSLPARADEEFCAVDVDTVLILDSSGSMAGGAAPSQCDWWNLEWVGGDDGSFQWVLHTDYGVDEAWCGEKDKSPSRPSTYTAALSSKMDSAKSAAKSFLDNLGLADQSALVFFNDTASLSKTLSNSHEGTKAAVDGLLPGGATNIGDAIALGIVELGSERANPQATKSAILLTDGKANRPNGPGHGEDSSDVAYALAQAEEAAALGYRIFTIGLGSDSDVNEAMLQSIADTTGAEYYHAADGNTLSDVYDQIAVEVCQYGSISGHKYLDADKDGEVDGAETLSGWEIALGDGSGGILSTQTTDENGYYVFTGLLAGAYTVFEGENPDKGPFIQTYPSGEGGGSYTIELGKGESRTGVDFGNYFPMCGNGILDVDEGEACDDGNTADGDGCSAACEVEVGGESATPDSLVINEILQNPSAVSDMSGEWFELYNPTENDIDILGCVIQPHHWFFSGRACRRLRRLGKERRTVRERRRHA